jgi:3D (Asp-Asp-Asp) domain-containing protein
VKPTKYFKLALMLLLLFASHFYALQLGWVFRDNEVDEQQAAIRALEQRLEVLRKESQLWQRSSRAFQETILRSRQRLVKVSAYSASKAECDDDPQIAASMQPPRPGTAAVSRDLFDMGWTFGKRIYLKGVGSYIINDVMHHRYQMRVDVFIDHKRAAREFGVRTTEAMLL